MTTALPRTSEHPASPAVLERWSPHGFTGSEIPVGLLPGLRAGAFVEVQP